jgi:protein-S-isoprenylcysteine O-methyltransferase Ste14
MPLWETLQRAVRPSRTRSTTILWAKSLLNAFLFFTVFMLALPLLAHWLLPAELPVALVLRTWLAGALATIGVAAWMACLDTFVRHGRGTPSAADARMRNPIMAAELLVIWAEVLYLSSWGVVLYAAAITAAAQVMVVCVEEPELRERFGEGYDEYCRDVPRWLPKLGGQP